MLNSLYVHFPHTKYSAINFFAFLHSLCKLFDTGGIPGFFEKSEFKKKSAYDKKACKITQFRQTKQVHFIVRCLITSYKNPFPKGRVEFLYIFDRVCLCSV